MPEIVGVCTSPGGTLLQNVQVNIGLIAAADGEAFGTAPDGSRIMGRTVTRSGKDGRWSVTLTANSLIEPAGTYYLVHEMPPNRLPLTYAIVVPNGPGPYDVQDLVAVQPDPPASLLQGFTIGAIQAADPAGPDPAAPDYGAALTEPFLWVETSDTDNTLRRWSAGAWIPPLPAPPPPVGGSGLHLFNSVDPTTVQRGTQGGNVLGTTFSTSQAGQVTAGRVIAAPDWNGQTLRFGIFVKGALTPIGSVPFTPSGITVAGWLEVPLTTPIAISVGTDYIAGLYVPSTLGATYPFLAGGSADPAAPLSAGSAVSAFNVAAPNGLQLDQAPSDVAGYEFYTDIVFETT
jgi:hypothetical protein